MTSTRGRTAPRSYRLQVVGQAARASRSVRVPITVGAGMLVRSRARAIRKCRESMPSSASRPTGIRIKDLGSTNGTWWQGTRVGEIVVPPGATIKFGSTPVRIAAADAPSLPPSDRDHFGEMAGQSVAMRELFAVLEMAAPTRRDGADRGRVRHRQGARRARDPRRVAARAQGPFVVVDCSAIAEQLIDSHLFGHVRGAFTGAERDRKGAFVEARAARCSSTSSASCRSRRRRSYCACSRRRPCSRVGADRPVKVDTRVVAATHRDLARMVAAKEFRFDLFYRLAVVHVALPPLRDRLEDLPHSIATFYTRRGAQAAAADRRRQPRQAAPLRVAGQHSRAAQRARARVGDVGRRTRRFATSSCGSIRRASAPQIAEVVDTSMPFKEAKERWNDHFERRYVVDGVRVEREQRHARGRACRPVAPALPRAAVQARHRRATGRRYGRRLAHEHERALRQLRDPVRAQVRRHGRGVARPAARSWRVRAARRDQDDPAGVRADRGRARDVPRRGRDPRAARSSRRRDRPRLRRRRRHAVHGDGVRRRHRAARHAPGAADRRGARARRGRAWPARGARGARSGRSAARSRPPRHLARQPDARLRRPRQGHRFRDRARQEPPGAGHRVRHGQGQAAVHVAGAGQERARWIAAATCSRSAW